MTRTTRKLVAFIVGVAFVLFAFGTLAWATSGFRNWNAAMWFDCWGKGTPQEIVKTEQGKTAANGGMRKDTAKSGLVYDSDESSATLNVVKPKTPLMKKYSDGVGFAALGSDFTGWKLYVNLYDVSHGLYDTGKFSFDLVSSDVNQSEFCKVTYDSIRIVFTRNIEQLRVSPDNNRVELEAYVVNSVGVRGDTFGCTFGNGEYLGTIRNPVYSYRFEGTKAIITCNTQGGNWHSLKIGIFSNKSELPSRVVGDTHLNSAPDFYYEMNTDVVTRIDNTYTIDLAALSFSGELHDCCTILALPYMKYGDSIYEVCGYIEPIHFSITKLAAPSNIRIQDGNLTWSGVSGAEGYSVFCGKENFTVTETSIALSEFSELADGDNIFRVRALGNVGASLAKSGKATAFNASSVITQVVMLTYNVDGDTVSKFVPYGKSVGEYLYDVEADGREFGGWYYDSGYSSAVNSQDKLENDTTIYARLSDKPVTERQLTWWERNMWYVLAPCIAVAGLALVIGIVLSIKKKKS